MFSETTASDPTRANSQAPDSYFWPVVFNEVDARGFPLKQDTWNTSLLNLYPFDKEPQTLKELFQLAKTSFLEDALEAALHKRVYLATHRFIIEKNYAAAAVGIRALPKLVIEPTSPRKEFGPKGYNLLHQCLAQETLSPLELAATAKLVKLLIEKGIDLERSAGNSDSAFSLAKKNMPTMLAILEDAAETADCLASLQVLEPIVVPPPIQVESPTPPQKTTTRLPNPEPGPMHLADKSPLIIEPSAHGLGNEQHVGAPEKIGPVLAAILFLPACVFLRLPLFTVNAFCHLIDIHEWPRLQRFRDFLEEKWFVYGLAPWSGHDSQQEAGGNPCLEMAMRNLRIEVPKKQISGLSLNIEDLTSKRKSDVTNGNARNSRNGSGSSMSF